MNAPDLLDLANLEKIYEIFEKISSEYGILGMDQKDLASMYISSICIKELCRELLSKKLKKIRLGNMEFDIREESEILKFEGLISLKAREMLVELEMI